MNIQKSIKIAMAYEGMSIKEMAEAIGVSEKHLSGYFNEKDIRRALSVEKLTKVSEVIGCKLSTLIDLADYNPFE